MDGSTCAVSVTGSLDFESVEQHELTLRAQDDDPVDRKSVARPLVISVLDVNEHTPVRPSPVCPSACMPACLSASLSAYDDDHDDDDDVVLVVVVATWRFTPSQLLRLYQSE